MNLTLPEQRHKSYHSRCLRKEWILQAIEGYYNEVRWKGKCKSSREMKRDAVPKTSLRGLSGFFSSGFPAKILYAFLICYVLSASHLSKTVQSGAWAWTGGRFLQGSVCDAERTKLSSAGRSWGHNSASQSPVTRQTRATYLLKGNTHKKKTTLSHMKLVTATCWSYSGFCWNKERAVLPVTENSAPVSDHFPSKSTWQDVGSNHELCLTNKLAWFPVIGPTRKYRRKTFCSHFAYVYCVYEKEILALWYQAVKGKVVSVLN
jgi:hypothetical protein